VWLWLPEVQGFTMRTEVIPEQVDLAFGRVLRQHRGLQEFQDDLAGLASIGNSDAAAGGGSEGCE
jgi:hypothetical protein